MLRRFALSLWFLSAASAPALAAPVQYGVGASFRYGSFAGFTSNGASLDLRLGKIALQGTVAQGDMDIKSSLEDDFWGLFPSNENYSIQKATIRQQAAQAMLKYHPMNGSFYFGFGAGRTVGTAKLEATGSGDGEVVSEKLVVTRDLSVVSIGNVWTPGGVMIGCEWGGIVGASNVKKEATSESNFGSNSDLEDLRGEFDDKVTSVSGKGTVHGLLIYLGVMLGA